MIDRNLGWLKKYKKIIFETDDGEKVAEISPQGIVPVKGYIYTTEIVKTIDPSKLQEYSTASLVRELEKRIGVSTMYFGPYEDGTITIDGPAVSLVVRD